MRFIFYKSLLSVSFLFSLLTTVCFAHGPVDGHVHGRYTSPTQIAADSGAVVRGVIADKRAVREGNTVYTEVTVNVTESWKGSSYSEPIIVRQSGGVLPELVTVSGPQPNWSIGEEWIFAVAESGKAWTLTGLTMGAFQIRGDNAERDMSGIHFVSAVPANVINRKESFSVSELKQLMSGQSTIISSAPLKKESSKSKEAQHSDHQVGPTDDSNDFTEEDPDTNIHLYLIIIMILIACILSHRYLKGRR